jgi:hypothetical protein
MRTVLEVSNLKKSYGQNGSSARGHIVGPNRFLFRIAWTERCWQIDDHENPDRYCRTGRRHGADVRFERGHRQKRHSQASWVRTSEHYVVRKAKGP